MVMVRIGAHDDVDVACRLSQFACRIGIVPAAPKFYN